MARARAAATLVLGLALLVLAMRGAHLDEVVTTLAGAHPGWLLAALALDAGVFALKSLKWQFVFRPVAALPLGRFFSGIAVGALANTALPLRLDEVVRSVYFGARTGVAKATVLGTILVERLVDATLLSLVAVACLAWLGLGWLPEAAPPVVAAVLAAGIITLLALAWGRDRLLRRVPAPLAGTLPERLAAGLAVLGPRRLAAVFGFGAVEWLLATLHVAAVLRAFEVRLPLAGDLAVVVASYLGFALPGAPGGLGLYELLVKTSLERGFFLDASTALGAALALHALLVVPIALAGAAILTRDGLSLASLRAAASQTAGGRATPEGTGGD